MADEELRFRAVGEDVSAGRMMDKLARGTNKASGEVKDLNRDFKNLDDQLGATETSLKGLLHEFAQTGDRTLFRDIRKDRSTINMLKSVRKELTGDAKGLGQGVGKAVTTGIGDALGALPAQLKGIGIVAGVALAVALTPAVGATVGAAILGGVGLGGIVGGIAAASQDPRVKAAGERLGDSLTDSFAEIGKPFIDPLIEQMGRLEGIGGSFFARLGEDIAPLADNLDDLVDGIEGFSENLDFGAAVKAAEPLLDVLADELPGLGLALTDMFEEISEGSEGSAKALKVLLNSVETGIVTFGVFVSTLSDVYEVATRYEGALAGLINGNIEVSDGITRTTTRLRGFGDAAEGTSEQIMGLSDAMDELFGKQMSVDEATIRYKQGLHDLKEELTDGKRTLSENTEEGRQNRSAVLDQIQAIEDLRQAQFEQTGNLQEANATYDKHIAQLRVTLAQLGYNKAQIEELIGAYQRLPKDGVDITVRSPGLWVALQRVRELAGLFGSLAAGRNAAEGNEPISGRASGGPVMAGKTYMVGEQGPELVTFGADGMVHNASQTAAMMSGASGGSSMAVQEIRLVIDVRGDDEEQVRRIRKQVEVLGGGNVQVAFGS